MLIVISLLISNSVFAAISGTKLNQDTSRRSSASFSETLKPQNAKGEDFSRQGKIKEMIGFSSLSAPSSEQFRVKQNQIPFYKTRLSSIPSGYSSLESLNEKLIQSESLNLFYLEKNKQKLSPEIVPHITAFHLSRFWVEKYTKRKVKANLKLSLNEILLNYETDPTDRGVVFTLKKTPLKTAATTDSRTLIKVDPYETFIPISFQNGFIKVLFKKKFGYIDINDCMSKFDFAKFVFSTQVKSKSWIPILQREFDQFLTKDKKLVSLNYVQGLIVDEKLALSFKNTDSFQIWNQFKIKKESEQAWNRSSLKGHGDVWWQRPFSAELNQDIISIDELLKKEITSVSFQKKSPYKGLIASDKKVYITEDGQTWSEIPQFRGFSGPVYYDNDKLMFVGNYKSVDGGRTFENYIKSDKISDVIYKHFGKIPKKIKITQIKMINPKTLSIEVDFGKVTKTKIKTSLFDQNWVIH